MSDQMRLELAANGAILYFRSEDDEDGPGEMAEVVEFPEGRPLEGVQRLLYTVLEWTGHAGSKHDRERIYIDIRAGQDYVEEYWVGKVQFLVDHLGGLEGNTEFTFPDGETWKVSKKK